MMYSNHFVMCVMRDGQPIKELANGVVKLPFGCEYYLRFRNKNSRRACVDIYIDGEKVSGNGYIIEPHSHVDIRRHYEVDRAFKFVALDSSEAQDFGKDGPNPDKVKGTIEARFRLEKERPATPIIREVHHHHDHYYPRPVPYRPWDYPRWGLGDTGTLSYNNAGDGTVKGINMLGASGSMCSSNAAEGTARVQSLRSRSLKSKSRDVEAPTSAPILDLNESELNDGCTVEGSSTGQTWRTVAFDPEEAVTSLRLFLQGYDGSEEVSVANSPKPKSKRVSELEEENERLRQELAEAENERLKKELAKKKPKRTRKKVAK